jgi:hypothetical protein
MRVLCLRAGLEQEASADEGLGDKGGLWHLRAEPIGRGRDGHLVHAGAFPGMPCPALLWIRRGVVGWPRRGGSHVCAGHAALQTGEVFGAPDLWHGLGIIIDTYDNDGKVCTPRGWRCSVARSRHMGVHDLNAGHGTCRATIRRSSGS